MGIKISLCMIVKNEEENLANCLNSVQGIADEIIIVDTGSTDKTVEVASHFTDKIYNFVWTNDFAEARNFSFSKATKDYILWLDADDIITEENKKKFIKLKKNLDKSIDYVAMYYNTAYSPNGSVNHVTLRERLVKRSSKFFWQNSIHENINVSGKGIKTDIYISHKNKTNEENLNSFKRNMEMLEHLVENGDESPRTLYYYGLMLEKLNRYDESLEVFKKFFTVVPDIFVQYSSACIAVHNLYLLKGDKDSALKILLDNKDKLDDLSEFHCTLGDYHKNILKDLNKACELYTRALYCNGILGGANIVLDKLESFYYFIPYYSLGECYMEWGKNVEALEYFKKALTYNEYSVDTKINIAKLETKIEIENLINILNKDK